MEKNIINAEIEMEYGGKIKLELYPDLAPVTVANFKKLAEEGFYDGLIFHRVISGFMIQGGDPLGSGFGGSDENIKGEFAANGFDNCQIVSWNPALWTAENAAECPSVAAVAAKLAEIRGLSLSELESLTDHNAENFLIPNP